jgi:hypothetical protein
VHTHTRTQTLSFFFFFFQLKNGKKIDFFKVDTCDGGETLQNLLHKKNLGHKKKERKKEKK